MKVKKKKVNKIMETETQLTEKIVALTMQIQEKHPELSKFLNEMPITIPDEIRPEINIKVLTDYFNSLTQIIKNSQTNKS